jgi:hypothetical protein
MALGATRAGCKRDLACFERPEEASHDVPRNARQHRGRARHGRYPRPARALPLPPVPSPRWPGKWRARARSLAHRVDESARRRGRPLAHSCCTESRPCEYPYTVKPSSAFMSSISLLIRSSQSSAAPRACVRVTQGAELSGARVRWHGRMRAETVAGRESEKGRGAWESLSGALSPYRPFLRPSAVAIGRPSRLSCRLPTPTGTQPRPAGPFGGNRESCTPQFVSRGGFLSPG